jgi:hypothetical protein
MREEEAGARYLSPLVKQDLANLDADGESRRIALKSLKHFVEQLDASTMPRFLTQVSTHAHLTHLFYRLRKFLRGCCVFCFCFLSLERPILQRSSEFLGLPFGAVGLPAYNSPACCLCWITRQTFTNNRPGSGLHHVHPFFDYDILTLPPTISFMD